MRAATKTTAARVSGRRNETGASQVSSDGSGKKYRAEGTNQEESKDKSAEWNGKETEVLVTKEEA